MASLQRQICLVGSIGTLRSCRRAEKYLSKFTLCQRYGHYMLNKLAQFSGRLAKLVVNAYVFLSNEMLNTISILFLFLALDLSSEY
ncbi:hypothetical protein CUMW_189120 [Citrus unshiu]|nr:hypothetical protein CUMW_189120 [Citrus unshiu]